MTKAEKTENQGVQMDENCQEESRERLGIWKADLACLMLYLEREVQV